MKAREVAADAWYASLRRLVPEKAPSEAQEEARWEARTLSLGPDRALRGHRSARAVRRLAYGVHVLGNLLAGVALLGLVGGAGWGVSRHPVAIESDFVQGFGAGAGVLAVAFALAGLQSRGVQRLAFQIVAVAAVVYGLRDEPDVGSVAIQAGLVLVFWSNGGRSITWRIVTATASGVPDPLVRPRSLDQLAYYRPERLFYALAAGVLVGLAAFAWFVLRPDPSWFTVGQTIGAAALGFLVAIGALSHVALRERVWWRWQEQETRRLGAYLRPPPPPYSRDR